MGARRLGAILANACDGRLHAAVLRDRDLYETFERRVAEDLEPRDSRERVVAQHALGRRRIGQRQAVV